MLQLGRMDHVLKKITVHSFAQTPFQKGDFWKDLQFTAKCLYYTKVIYFKNVVVGAELVTLKETKRVTVAIVKSL